MTKNTQRFESEKFEIYLMEDKLIYTHFFEDVEGDLEEIKQSLAFQESVGVDETFKRIVHAERYVTITKEAREYLEKNAATVKAEAYIIDSLAQKILFNLYVKLRSNKHPLKAFNTLEGAKQWLSEF